MLGRKAMAPDWWASRSGTSNYGVDRELADDRTLAPKITGITRMSGRADIGRTAHGRRHGRVLPHCRDTIGPCC